MFSFFLLFFLSSTRADILFFCAFPVSLPWVWHACCFWWSLLTIGYVSWFYVEAKAYELKPSLALIKKNVEAKAF
jgi:hypothetical protein